MTSSKNDDIIKNLHILNHLEIVLMCAKFHGHSFLQSIVHGSKGIKTGANRPCQISTSTNCNMYDMKQLYKSHIYPQS